MCKYYGQIVRYHFDSVTGNPAMVSAITVVGAAPP